MLNAREKRLTGAGRVIAAAAANRLLVRTFASLHTRPGKVRFE